MQKKEVKQLLGVAIFAGKLMLVNGAETYRVEDTITRIVQSRGIENIQNFTVPTGIFVSCEYDDEQYSYIERTRSNRIDLEIISMVNRFSREFVAGDMSLEEAMERLKHIEKAPLYPPLVTWFFGGISGGFFAMMFGATWLEGMLAFVTSFMVVFAIKQFRKVSDSYFLRNVFGGTVNACVAFLLIFLFSPIDPELAMDRIVIGSIMPLVPGVAITNALRDSINGDFVTGVSKMTEALITALGIAIGVGLALQAISSFGGVIS